MDSAQRPGRRSPGAAPARTRLSPSGSAAPRWLGRTLLAILLATLLGLTLTTAALAQYPTPSRPAPTAPSNRPPTGGGGGGSAQPPGGGNTGGGGTGNLPVVAPGSNPGSANPSQSPRTGQATVDSSGLIWLGGGIVVVGLVVVGGGMVWSRRRQGAKGLDDATEPRAEP